MYWGEDITSEDRCIRKTSQETIVRKWDTSRISWIKELQQFNLASERRDIHNRTQAVLDQLYYVIKV